MEPILSVLDDMEEIRQKAAEHPKNYPVDYTIRLLEAIVAKYALYEGRTQWTGELKQDPESNYSRRLRENRFHP